MEKITDRERKIWPHGILAIVFAAQGIFGVLEFAVERETGRFWFTTGGLVFAALFFSFYLRRAEDFRLAFVSSVAFIAIMVVGWYRTEDLTLAITILLAVVILGWLSWRLFSSRCKQPL